MKTASRQPAICLAALLATTLLTPALAHAALGRVGPTDPVNGFPVWYQDKTGITLEFCSPTTQHELDAGYCLILPPTPISLAPEVFPTNFSDEHFYWAADAVVDFSNGGRGKLVQGLEGAFAVGPVIPGDQIVFARLRFDLRDLPLSGTYKIYTPFGIRTFPNQVGGLKTRLFYTEDIGLVCAPGDFSCALNGALGPFLLPAATPGGAELAAFTDPLLPGRKYIADPARVGPVTGSVQGLYQTSSGPLDPNRFRIEVINGATTTVISDTTDFTLMGRYFQGAIPSPVAPDRASYARTATTQQIDVMVKAGASVQARTQQTPPALVTVPQLAIYPAPCTGTLGPDGVTLIPPFGAPAGATSVPLASDVDRHYVQLRQTAIPTHLCLVHANARNGAGQLAPVYFNLKLNDKVHVAEATYDPSARTLVVQALSMDSVVQPALTVGGFGSIPDTLVPATGAVVLQNVIAPPGTIRVSSAQGGADEMQVTAVAGTGVANSAPLAAADQATTLAGLATDVNVLANDSDPDGDPIRVSGVSQPASGTVAINGGLSVVYTPAAGFVGSDAFTYTITDDRGGFATATVIVTVNLAPNLAPTAAPDAATTAFNTPVTVPVLLNDSDPNGDPLAVVGADFTNPNGTITFTPTTVTFTPNAGFSGTATFVYVVSDGRGGLTPGLVTVTVRPAETIAFTLAQFRAPNDWRLAGTGSIDGSVITIFAGPTLGGQVIGTATVAGGTWTFRSTTTGVPGNSRVSASSSGGAVRLNQIVSAR